MDRKPTKNSGDRSRKRRFHGNRFTVDEDTSFTSTSAAKLSKSADEDVIISNNCGYCILEFFCFYSYFIVSFVCYVQERN
ncbi:unnamed protein product [Euphydryas editha]|uniref:Uncharacterized protein n=1 Tax=Euphydryas editha TaxID=104508 RepID=A0AAU9UPA4_EUPED|nr:unnamed protein product [Euphydryas editha]